MKIREIKHFTFLTGAAWRKKRKGSPCLSQCSSSRGAPRLKVLLVFNIKLPSDLLFSSLLRDDMRPVVGIWLAPLR